MGLAFFPNRQSVPEKLRNGLLFAYHGSWNRSKPTGYKIVLFRFDGSGKLLGQEDFISGWLRDDGRVIGRPVDVLILPSGLLYITDDKAGVIYRGEWETYAVSKNDPKP